ncbi:hypothetical protein Syun_007547 [Stephania yunnanensis]|uniref:Uncharacterized protein n=1 Tax=Stephania yunnanensis TaxID=152371 RepID=A0AAP0KYX6_9MAGN
MLGMTVIILMALVPHMRKGNGLYLRSAWAAAISHSQFRRYRRNVFSHICWSLKELLGDLV